MFKKDKITFVATANNSKKTYTLRRYTNGRLCTKFRTLPMNQQEFDDCWYKTDGDWKEFLKSEDYFIVDSYNY